MVMTTSVPAAATRRPGHAAEQSRTRPARRDGRGTRPRSRRRPRHCVVRLHPQRSYLIRGHARDPGLAPGGEQVGDVSCPVQSSGLPPTPHRIPGRPGGPPPRGLVRSGPAHCRTPSRTDVHGPYRYAGQVQSSGLRIASAPARVRRREVLPEREGVRRRPGLPQVQDPVLGLGGGGHVPARDPPQRGVGSRPSARTTGAGRRPGRWVSEYTYAASASTDSHTDMLTSTPALPPWSQRNAWTEVAFPSSVCSRHTNPGAVSAAALTGSRAATKPASRGLSSGSSSR